MSAAADITFPPRPEAAAHAFERAVMFFSACMPGGR